MSSIPSAQVVQPLPHLTGIGKRIGATIDAMNANDPEGALFQISSAIDATAQKEYGAQGRKTYKNFITDNMVLITRFALGGGVEHFNFQYTHPDIKSDANGMCRLEDILYHAIRCAQYHTAAMPSDIIFIAEKKILMRGNQLCLPASLINGFVLAVVCAPCNSAEKSGDQYIVGVGDPQTTVLKLDSLWGKRAEFLWLLGAVVYVEKTPPAVSP